MEDDQQGQPGGFCVVANIAEQTASGEGGLDLRRGAKHFAAGAKVWVLPPQWGDGGDQLIVAGYHRGTRGRGLVRMVLSRRHLTGFRVQAIYSPAVLRALSRPLTELGRDHPRSYGPAARKPSRWQHPGATGRSPPAPKMGRSPLRPWSPTRRRWNSPATDGPTTWPTSTPAAPSTRPASRPQNRRQANAKECHNFFLFL